MRRLCSNCAVTVQSLQHTLFHHLKKVQREHAAAANVGIKAPHHRNSVALDFFFWIVKKGVLED